MENPTVEPALRKSIETSLGYCDGCDVWFHGNCIALSDEQLNILASVATSCLFCQPCFDQRKNTTPVKGFELSQIEVVVKKALDTCLPPLVERCLNEKLDTACKLPVKFPPSPKAIEDTSCTLRVNGIPEEGSNLFENIQSDSARLKAVFVHIGEYEAGNISAVRRLGKFVTPKTDKESAKSRPRTLLVTFTNPWSARKCLARSSHLKSFDYSVNISQSLTGEQRVMEKKILSTRYNMIQSGKLRVDFRIRDLKLYYTDELVQLPNDTVAPNSVVKAN